MILKPGLNRKWHLAHPMPGKATLDQRIAWHIAHSRNCNCRAIPRTLQAEIKKRNKANK